MILTDTSYLIKLILKVILDKDHRLSKESVKDRKI
jgi:hypothetical protein